MIITRYNYEEFFLLYVDKELDSEKRKAVANFIKQNPDLGKELEMLSQTTLFDDNIQFNQKERLYKKDNGISLANYEEYFLLYADNELNESAVAETHDFILKHPQLQQEFTLLLQTKLAPELVEFTNKSILYRNQKNLKRTIPAWLRISAAAAITGLIAVTWFFNYTDKISPDKAVANNVEKPAKVVLEKSKILPAQKSVTEKTLAAEVKKERKNKVEKVAVSISKKAKINSAAAETMKKSQELARVTQPESNLKEEAAQPNKNLPETEAASEEQVYTDPQQVAKRPADNNDKIINDVPVNHAGNSLAKQTVAAEQSTLFKHAVYLETDNEEERGVYIGSAEISKIKLKGLFKKATNFLGKKVRQKNN